MLPQSTPAADLTKPQFVRLVDADGKLFGASRDADYDYAAIDGTHSYLIAGVRGHSLRFDCTVYAPDGKGHNRITANINDDGLTLGERGEFALYLSATPPPPQLRSANWVALTADATAVIVRQCLPGSPARFDIVCMTARRPNPNGYLATRCLRLA